MFTVSTFSIKTRRVMKVSQCLFGFEGRPSLKVKIFKERRKRKIEHKFSIANLLLSSSLSTCS